MPWSNNNGGSKGGGGPWGHGASNGNSQPPKNVEPFGPRNQNKLKDNIPSGGGLGFLGSFLIFLVVAAAVAYFGFTVRINPDEVGVVQRFGKLDRQLYSGLHYRWPYPIEDVTVILYTKPDHVVIGNQSTEGEMLTGDENISNVNFTVFWNVNDPAAYLFNVKQHELQTDGSRNASRNVKAVAESAMREVIGKRNANSLTESRQEIQEAVQTLMQQILDNYGSGIKIISVNLQPVDPPAAVIDSSRDVQAARADQQRYINEAKQYENTVVPEARGKAQRILQDAQGYKERVINEARGNTDRFVKIYEEYAKAPEVTRRRMYLETMEHIFANIDKTIIDEKASASGVIPYLPLAAQGQNGGQK